MNKMEGHSLEVHLVVVVSIYSGFSFPPVKFVPPRVQKRLQIFAVHPETPIFICKVGGKTSVVDSAMEIGYVFIWNIDGERFRLRHMG